ncbi:molybdate ABC transporter substrate-binding protein [Amycolatopsis roodepoortensis]|uniref:Molybdate transport system substrate-binding protein n=1 Tax=Amycolatopsis roodepoortensis TaxID=700274 RepID=A0ABR9LAF8_9PSEU|nr:substrate-binding domain-containing protein [Amycolatopsis roodepoortensis]MBE1577091.1 molybdate transport system substrate-binding protein [Amycolatopsis roodepoortensis]
MISLFSALSVKKALDDVLLHAFTTRHAVDVEVTFDPTTILVEKIGAGAEPDVVIAVSSAFAGLEATGAVIPESRVVLAKSGIGIATAPELVDPDIATVDALRATLTSARSVAYSRSGASGIYFARLLEELGIADEVNKRATVVEKGFTALAVTDGRADLAVQQISELKFVPQARVVGPLPDGAQHYSELSAALGRTAPPEAAALLRFLSSAEAMAAYRDAGLVTEGSPRTSA